MPTTIEQAKAIGRAQAIFNDIRRVASVLGVAPSTLDAPPTQRILDTLERGKRKIEEDALKSGEREQQDLRRQIVALTLQVETLSKEKSGLQKQKDDIQHLLGYALFELEGLRAVVHELREEPSTKRRQTKYIPFPFALLGENEATLQN